MKVGVCLDCGLRLVLRHNIGRSVRRHFKHCDERYAIEMKPEGRAPEFYKRFYWFRGKQ